MCNALATLLTCKSIWRKFINQCESLSRGAGPGTRLSVLFSVGQGALYILGLGVMFGTTCHLLVFCSAIAKGC